MLSGLLPLILLISISGLTYGTLLLTQQYLAASPFPLQQQASLVIITTGLLIALVAYIATAWRLFRHMRNWYQKGMVTRVKVTLLMLFITALIVLLPLIIALLIPQNPAPPI